jgi:hypothetical protein
LLKKQLSMFEGDNEDRGLSDETEVLFGIEGEEEVRLADWKGVFLDGTHFELF